jgi:hypothetical protein
LVKWFRVAGERAAEAAKTIGMISWTERVYE